MSKKSDKMVLILFIVSLMLTSYVYGVFSQRDNLFPVSMYYQAKAAVSRLFTVSQVKLPWYLIQSKQQQQALVHNAQAMQPGLTLLSGLADTPGGLGVKIVNQQGDAVYHWDINWFTLWPNATHLAKNIRPKSKPGTSIHGITLLDNGDLVFNFEHMGLIRIDGCGEVVWRLPYRTHHSIYTDEQGNFWVPGQFTHTEPVDKYPNYIPPFDEYTILKVSPDGKILDEISVFDLLIDNGLQGLLYMTGSTTSFLADTLHLNDVELFPTDMVPGVFVPGDVMISLRNVHAVLVFNLQDKKVKFKTIGATLMQHDPDFIDGNTISIFDNNTNTASKGNYYSKIVTVSAIDGQIKQVFSGSQSQPFFTYVLGKHQQLKNGNILIAESIKGRVFEVDSQGNLAWEYFNKIGPDLLGIVNDAERLPAKFNQEFFKQKKAYCQKKQNEDKQK